MYVGITRAMKKLYLSYAVTRYRYGEMTYSVKSRFLDEIDQSLIRFEATTRKGHMTAYRRRKGEFAFISPGGGAPTRRSMTEDSSQYFSDSTPSYEDESQESISPTVGSSVSHDLFGKGRIVAIDGRGENTRAVVDFESVGRKHLMLKFAHLRAG